MQPKRRLCLLLIFLLLGAARPLAAQSNEEPEHLSFQSLQLHWENDLFTDGFYTNGTKIDLLYYCAKGRTCGDNRHPGAIVAPAVKWVLEKSALASELDQDPAQASIGVGIGQNQYTSQDIRRGGISFGDRPYAAWSYIGFPYQATHESETLDVEVMFGAMGRAAMGKEAQTEVHKVIGSAEPEGWGYQKQSEVGVNVWSRYNKRARIGVEDFVDICLGGDANVGNVFTNIGPAVTFRTGLRERGCFTPTAIQENRNPQNQKRHFQAFFFLRMAAKYVGHNALIEGGGTDGRTYTAENLDGPRTLAFERWSRERPEQGTDHRVIAYQALVANPRFVRPEHRFYLYDETFADVRPENRGLNMLIYYTLFLDGERMRDNMQIYTMHELLKRDGLEFSNTEAYFLAGTFFRPEGESLRPEMRYLAYDLLTRDDASMTDTEKLFVFSALFQANQYSPGQYVAPTRRGYVEADWGIAFQVCPVMFGVSTSIRTAEFEPGKGIPAEHAYNQFFFRYNHHY